uniref:C2H2-type domain-containing protein n=1 Tax=Glossina brevipalpis TaxID=37001 RepID=A0A1A9X307_9MUSC
MQAREVEQSFGLLDTLNATTRREALHYLLQSLKFKYTDDCNHVARRVFADIVEAPPKEAAHLLLNPKKEEIKSETENSSTDLNQNFEKILCKEEFMCLDEDEVFTDDVDNESTSALSKRMRYASIRGVANRDPLDFIPSGLTDSRRLGKAHSFEDGSNCAGVLIDVALKRNRQRAFGHQINNQNSRLQYPRRLIENLPHYLRLGERYVFHPDSEFTVHFHHRTSELSIHVFKEQFRIRLKVALTLHHKPFLKEFYNDFILTGRLLGVTPPKNVLQTIRAEREMEWRQQTLRKQESLRQQQLLSRPPNRHMLSVPISGEPSAVESEMEFEVEASAPQEIMKFEEIIEEGMGPGRLIDGLVMEPEIEDVIGERSTSVSGTSGSGSSNSSAGNGLEAIPSEMVTSDCTSTLTAVQSGSDATSLGNSSFSNNLSRTQEHQDQQQSNSSLGINGLTPISNNSTNSVTVVNDIQQEQRIVDNNFTTFSSKEQQQQGNNHQHIPQEQQALQHNDLEVRHMKTDGIAINNSLQLQSTKPSIQHNINNIINNSMHPQQHFQAQQQQRYMHMQQQQNHLNSHIQAQNHPLAMIGGMMESANQQHQQQLQAQRVQQHVANSLANSIDSILDGTTASRPQPSAQQIQFLHYQQQQQHLPPHMQNVSQQQQMQQQPTHTNAMMSPMNMNIGGVATTPVTLQMSGSLEPKSVNASFEQDDHDISHDEDEDDHENDTNDGMETKTQLIDGGSSSSTSLQAPSSGSNPGGGAPAIQAGSAMGPKKEKPSYSCLLCPKSYRKRKSLLDHYKIHPGYCHDCGKPNGTSLEEIIHHNRTMHAKEYPFVCETCGESYSRRQQFHAHVESHNKKDIKTYSCHECGQKFTHKKMHQQHLDDTGHKADGAICEVCGDEFPSKNALYQHIMRVHKKDNFFECHICQNRFTLKANLERHVQLHTEIKRTYVCDICGSSYFTYPALKDHYSNAHTDASECKCTLCGKRFGSVKSLQRHLPSHSEERPHCCCYCDQTFKWKTHLVRHKQTVHGNQPSPKKVKRFTKEGDELVSMADVPGPPPAKVAKKSNASKPKQQPNQQQQQQIGSISTPPPLSTTPGTSSSSQQEQFNAAIISNNSSQSSTASTSQHSLSANEPQSGSLYSQNFSTEKLLGQQQQQSVHTPHSAQHLQSQPQQQQQQQQQRPTPPPTHHQQQQHHRHTPNIDSAEFLGLPMNVTNANPAAGAPAGQVSTTQQPQQPSQPQAMVGSNKPSQPQQQQPQQQQEQPLGGDLMGFQNMWPQPSTTNQLTFGGAAQPQQQQQQQQQPPPPSNSQQHPQQPGSNSQATAATTASATDPHSYNNIGSILTNLIDNNPNPMEYNFEMMQQGTGVTAAGITAATGTPSASVSQTPQQPPPALHNPQQQQQQQQHHPAAYGLQASASAAGLIRHSAGVYGATSALYEVHHPAHHATGLADMSEQQKNSFQPYHPHSALQPHAHSLGAHPLAPTAHHPLTAASHLLPHAGHHVYDRGGYSVLGAEEPKTVLPPITDYMHHMQQQQHAAALGGGGCPDTVRQFHASHHPPPPPAHPSYHPQFPYPYGHQQYASQSKSALSHPHSHSHHHHHPHSQSELLHWWPPPTSTTSASSAPAPASSTNTHY